MVTVMPQVIANPPSTIGSSCFLIGGMSLSNELPFHRSSSVHKEEGTGWTRPFSSKAPWSTSLTKDLTLQLLLNGLILVSIIFCNGLLEPFPLAFQFLNVILK